MMHFCSESLLEKLVASFGFGCKTGAFYAGFDFGGRRKRR